MKIVGLVGGVASGKSLVARLLAEQGAIVLDADRAGHEVLRLPEVERAAKARWGREIFGADGHVERQKLAKIVFAGDASGRRELAYLESITHPKIGERLLEQIAAAKDSGRAIAVLDAPVLLKAGWDRLCDSLVFVDAPRELRIARAAQRGWSAEELAAREAHQEPIEEKRRQADVVIDNSGSPEATRLQVESFVKSLGD